MSAGWTVVAQNVASLWTPIRDYPLFSLQYIDRPSSRVTSCQLHRGCPCASSWVSDSAWDNLVLWPSSWKSPPLDIDRSIRPSSGSWRFMYRLMILLPVYAFYDFYAGLLVLFYSFFNKNHIQSRSGAGMAAENIIVLSFNVWSCVINWSILIIVVSAHRPTHPFSSLLFPEIKTHRQAFAQVAFAIGELYCCMAPWMQHWNILKHRDGQCKTLSMWLCVNWFLLISES